MEYHCKHNTRLVLEEIEYFVDEIVGQYHDHVVHDLHEAGRYLAKVFFVLVHLKAVEVDELPLEGALLLLDSLNRHRVVLFFFGTPLGQGINAFILLKTPDRGKTYGQVEIKVFGGVHNVGLVFGMEHVQVFKKAGKQLLGLHIARVDQVEVLEYVYERLARVGLEHIVLLVGVQYKVHQLLDQIESNKQI